jgi:hypothetical protein
LDRLILRANGQQGKDTGGEDACDKSQLEDPFHGRLLYKLSKSIHQSTVQAEQCVASLTPFLYFAHL